MDGKPILKGIDLSVKAGEVHAIMGPNGSGKSTLAQVLAGRDDYEVTSGAVTFNGADLLDLKPEERARAGHLPGLPIPGGNPRRQQHLLSQGGAERMPQGARRAGTGRDGVPGAGARQKSSCSNWTRRC